MKKALKIILFVILSIVVVFILIIAGNVIASARFYKNAEDLRGLAFGVGDANATINGKLFLNFNSELKDCKLAYGDNWMIKGIKKDKCKVVYSGLDTSDDNCYNYGNCDDGTMELSYKTHVCYLPEEVYGNPESIDWILENKNYCSTQ